MFKLDLEKAEEPEIKLPYSLDHQKSKSSRKTSTSALLTTRKPLTVWITTNCRKFSKRWEYQVTLPGSWEICMQVRKQQLELDMKQQTGSKLGKEYVKAVLLYMLIFLSSFIYFYWRPIILQYCGGFCHILTWISHGCTCTSLSWTPLPLPSSSHPLGYPSAQALSGLLHASNMDWSGTSGKDPACLHRWLFNFYAEYLMRNAELDEQAVIKIARRNINNLRYTDDNTLMAESEEELKSLLMKVKEESEKAGLGWWWPHRMNLEVYLPLRFSGRVWVG